MGRHREGHKDVLRPLSWTFLTIPTQTLQVWTDG
jgi:hypothetical protein